MQSDLWEKVPKGLTDDDIEERRKTRAEQPRQEEYVAQGSIDRLRRELANLAEERQWVSPRAGASN